MTATQFTGIVLAGGRGSRLSGADKGLMDLQGRPLIAHVLERLRPQVSTLLISANRNLDQYAQFAIPVVHDEPPSGCEPFTGPLAGVLAGMSRATTPFVAVVPCDAPRLSVDLIAQLDAARQAQRASACYAHDGSRAQFVFAVLASNLRGSLHDYLARGERSVEGWYSQIGAVRADCSHLAASFANLNTPADFDAARDVRP